MVNKIPISEDIEEISKYIQDFPNKEIYYFGFTSRQINYMIRETCKQRYNIFRVITDFKEIISEDIQIRQLGNGRFSTKIDGISYASLNQKSIFVILDKLDVAISMVKLFKSQQSKIVA